MAVSITSELGFTKMYLRKDEILDKILELKIAIRRVRTRLTMPKLPSPNFSITLNRCLENSNNKGVGSGPPSYESSFESVGNFNVVNFPMAKCCSPDSSCGVQEKDSRAL